MRSKKYNSKLDSSSRRRLLLAACAVAGVGVGYSIEAATDTEHKANADRPMLEKGVNLSDWFQYSKTSRVTDMQLQGLKEVGFDHVRLPVDPEALGWRPEAKRGEAPFTRLGQLDTTIESIRDAGLTVILDMHPGRETNTYLKKNLDNVEPMLINAWEFLAGRYRKYGPKEICFELMNEPYRFYPAEKWNVMQGKLIKAVRRQTDKHWLVVSGVWDPISSLRTIEPYQDQRVIYGFHFYKPFVVTHQGANWEPSAAKLLPHLANIPYPSSELDLDKLRLPLKPGADEDYIRSKLEAYKNENWNLARIRKSLAFNADWARSNRVPILCTEVGVMRKAIDKESRLRWLSDVTKAMAEADIGWTLWDYCDDFGIAQCGANPTVIEPELISALHLKE
jgi:endoglucanase